MFEGLIEHDYTARVAQKTQLPTRVFASRYGGKFVCTSAIGTSRVEANAKAPFSMISPTCASERDAGVAPAGTQMRRDIALLWANALQSGRFRQGSRHRLLEAQGRHSALGVLCELHREMNPGMLKLRPHGACYLGESSALPRAVMSWAGLQPGNEQGPRVAICSNLTSQWRAFTVNVHDFMGVGFVALADALRSQI
ncbi:MAG: hypothetical protein EPN79_10700 [Burkholderiaceae bacterium]|nr:MAG: hypothetical protein EPN79_10700 [Burkholderiaceae bacterium]TBR76844.1 MAG: hypothetical protein EPN64_06375 [Burkholderiaceae bacterium]